MERRHHNVELDALEQRAELFRRQARPPDGGKNSHFCDNLEPDRIGQGHKIFAIAARHRQSGIGLMKRGGNALVSSSCMLGRTGRPGRQGSASLRLAIEQAPWSTHAGCTENAIVDDLDALDRMADLSLPPAAAEAAGLQKANSLSVNSKVWNPRGLEKDDSGRPSPPQLSIASQHWPDGVGREVFVCLSLSL